MKYNLLKSICIITACLLALGGCKRAKKEPATQFQPILEAPSLPPAQLTEPIKQEGPIAQPIKKNKHEKKRIEPKVVDTKKLDFDVENQTSKIAWVTCFSYIKKNDFTRWRWDKSAVYRLEPGHTITIDIDDIPNEQDSKATFGYLGIFSSQEEADQATYELTNDANLLDLDLLSQLRGKKVTLEIEKYGSRGEFFDYDFVRKTPTENEKTIEQLDFFVENQTGKTIWVTCFVYEKKAKGNWIASLEEKDDMSVWRFDKTTPIKMAPGELKMIDVDTIRTLRDKEYVRGYLAVFDENEEKQVQDATYELLESKRKLNVGELARLKNKKIVLNVEKYNIAQSFVDFVIKPAKKIEFAPKPRAVEVLPTNTEAMNKNAAQQK